MTNFLIVLDVILGVILLGFLGFWAYNRIQAKRLGGAVTALPLITFASPQSIICTSPYSPIMILSGLRSRCITPRL